MAGGLIIIIVTLLTYFLKIKKWQRHGKNIGKKNQRTAGVSACWFNATNDKKHVYHLINTPFVRMHADQLPVEQVDF